MSTRRVQELLDESRAKGDQIQAKDNLSEAQDEQIQIKNRLNIQLQRDNQALNDEILISEKERKNLQVFSFCWNF